MWCLSDWLGDPKCGAAIRWKQVVWVVARIHLRQGKEGRILLTIKQGSSRQDRSGAVCRGRG